MSPHAPRRALWLRVLLAPRELVRSALWIVLMRRLVGRWHRTSTIERGTTTWRMLRHLGSAVAIAGLGLAAWDHFDPGGPFEAARLVDGLGVRCIAAGALLYGVGRGGAWWLDDGPNR